MNIDKGNCAEPGYADQETEWIESVYARLIETGCTPGTANRLKDSVSKMSVNTMDAFFIWASGHSIREAARLCGVNHETVRKAINKCRRESGSRDMSYIMGSV